MLQSIYTTIISNIQKPLGKSSDWIIDSVIDHTINISKYKPLALAKRMRPSKKRIDQYSKYCLNECFKWSIVRYLNHVDHNPRRTTKADKDFARKLDFKNMKFPVKIRDIYKIGKEKNFTRTSVFGYENKEKHTIYVVMPQFVITVALICNSCPDV